MDSNALVLKLPAAHAHIQIIYTPEPRIHFRLKKSQSEKKKEQLQSVVGFEPARTVKLLQEKKKKKATSGV